MAKRGFKSGQDNPVNALKRELAAVQQQLAEERLKPMLQQFTDRLATSILTILATKPYSEWPKEAQLAFEHEQRKTPTAAHFYVERLPK